jgi:3-deoxy-7-phosphoheptulonate synthase
MNKDLLKLRKQIDNIDDDLLEILKKRFDVVQKISKIKKEFGLHIEDSVRQTEIVDRLYSKSNDKILYHQLEKMYSSIFESAKEKQLLLSSREYKKENSVYNIHGKIIGEKPVLIAGPCSVDDGEEYVNLCCKLKESGVSFLRGGIYKPRTSPYSFQGLGEEGSYYLRKAKEKTGLPIVSEVLDIQSAEESSEVIDIFQIGTRNMQNFSLLKSIAKLGKPVLLKRGMSATLEEFILSSEYLLSNGCNEVILCERGIRTFNTHVRNTLDVSIIPIIKEISHLPIIIDPSHSSGNRKYVLSHTLAGISSGADGVLIEVHQNPKKALTDGEQAILPDELVILFRKVLKTWAAIR